MIARASVLLLLAGLALGAAAPRATRTSPPTVDGFAILEGDFHVHAFPGDGALTPGRLRDLAADEGLDVLTITNHNQILASHLFPREEGPMVLLGEEVTNPDFHLIAVGITHAVDWNQPAVRAIADVHAQGGVAIAAHPDREFWEGWDQAAMAAVDGVEVAHPMLGAEPETRGEFEAFFDRALAVNPDVARIGSSDYHVTQRPGECRTYLFARERSRAGVIEAIRSGRTVARRVDGTLIGDPALVALVRAHRREPPPHTSIMATLSAVLVWAGIAGLALLSSTGRG
jgi:SAM-dependent methyltransferase